MKEPTKKSNNVPTKRHPDGYFDNTNETALDDWKDFQHLMASAQLEAGQRLRTGFEKVDRLMGGLSGTVILAGPPEIGKTSFALSMTVSAIEKHDDICVLFVSLVMSKTEIYDRLLNRESGVPYPLLHDARKDSPEADRLLKARKYLRSSVLPRLCVIDQFELNLPDSISAEELLARIEQCKSSTGCKRCFVIIDPLDELQLGQENSGRYSAAYPADAKRMHLLLRIQQRTRRKAFPYGDPFLLITYVTKRYRPPLSLSDVLGSVDRIQIANSVLLLEPALDGPPWKSEDDDVEKLCLRIAKTRDFGRHGEVRLNFDFRRSQFKELIESDSSKKRVRRPR